MTERIVTLVPKTTAATVTSSIRWGNALVKASSRLSATADLRPRNVLNPFGRVSILPRSSPHRPTFPTTVLLNSTFTVHRTVRAELVEDVLRTTSTGIAIIIRNLRPVGVQATRPLIFDVTRSADGELFIVEDKKFGICAASTALGDLRNDVENELSFLWREYAEAPVDALTDGGQRLRQALLRAFTRIDETAPSNADQATRG